MRAWIVSVVIIATLTVTTASQGQTPAEQDNSQAPAKLSKDRLAELPALLAAMDGDDLTARKTGRDTLFRLVHKAAGSADRQAVASVLADELTGSGAPKHTFETSQFICEMLGFLGPEQAAVEALARGLANEQIREPARQALARIEGQSATLALVAALAGAEESFKVDIINALAERADPATGAALLELATKTQGQVSEAAWKALARIPSADALEAFGEAVKSKDQLAPSLLLDYADTLLKAGMLAEADKVLALRKQAGPIEGLDRCRFVHLHAHLGTPESIRVIMDALEHSDLRIRGAALEAAAILPGTEVTRMLTETMNASQGQARIDLLEVLGKRGRQMDDRTVMLMFMAMLDQDEDVKIACIRAMEQAGVTSTVPTMLNLLNGPSEAVADAAEGALSRIPGQTVTAQVVQALPRSRPSGRARLLRILSVRDGSGAAETILGYVADPAAEVRAAAYESLGRLKAENAFEALVSALDGNPGPDRDAAERSLKALDSEIITAKLLSGYFEYTNAQKPSVLRVLTLRQLEAIDALLVSESKSSDELIRQAAIAGLTERAKPGTAPALLDAAKAGPPAITDVALTGYLKTAASIESADASTAASMYMQAFPLAASAEQRRTLLAGLRRVGDPAAPGVFELLLPLLKDGDLREEAAGALVGLASRLDDSQTNQAISVLHEVLKTTEVSETRAAAIAHLRELGIQTDPAHEQGFITCWQLLGPIDRNWDPPGTEQLNAGAPLTIAGRQFNWKRHHTPDPQGIVKLHEAVGSVAGMSAFAVAEVSVETARQVLLKVGSDDGIILWVNGRQVHAATSDRLLTVDQDTVRVKLEPGKNSILARILQADGSWQFCLRVVGPDGKPIVLQQTCE